MIDIDNVKELVEKKIENTNCFLVNISIAEGNSIAIELDADTGVSLDFCSELSNYINSEIDREIEDYSLEVGSYSITKPFLMPQQYKKNIGRDVEVLLNIGKKLKGTLVEATDSGFVVETTERIKEENSKRKTTKQLLNSIEYSEIKYTKLMF